MNLLVILGLDGGTTSTVCMICMPIMPFSDALPDPLHVLAHAIAGCSNHNSVGKYCEKYVKPEDVGAEKVKSSDEELSEDEYAASDDEEIAGKLDL